MTGTSVRGEWVIEVIVRPDAPVDHRLHNQVVEMIAWKFGDCYLVGFQGRTYILREGEFFTELPEPSQPGDPEVCLCNLI